MPRLDVGLGAGKKMLWDVLVKRTEEARLWERKVCRCKPHSASFSPQEPRPFQSLNLSIGAGCSMVKNKAAHTAPVLHMDSQWLPEQGSCHCPICQPHLAHPRDGSVPWEVPIDVGLRVQQRTLPALSRTAPAAAQGKPTPGEAVEKETVPFNDPSPP